MGIVFDIARCSYHDGPGIRTTVFLKGCNLRCAWCHNPESFRMQPQIELTPALCIRCERCKSVCPNGVHAFRNGKHIVRGDRCISCGACLKQCPQNALRIVGREQTAAEVMEIVLRDSAYYEQSGGGVTFSGGEPTMQPVFLVELLTIAKANALHTALETNGMISSATLERILPLVDLFLLDNKSDDSDALSQWTCGNLATWRRTLTALNEAGKPVILRLPIIPGINDTEAHFQAAAALQKEFPCIRSLEIMPYHTIGVSKWEGLGYDYSLTDVPSATDEQKALWNRLLSDASRCQP